MATDFSAGRVALITGGAGGIGRAMTRALVENGVRVGVMDIDAAAARDFAAEMNTDFGDDVVAPISGDVADEADCGRAVSETVAKFGRLDILVNNAGIGISSIRPDGERRLPGVLELTPEIWRRFFAINTTGAFLMTRSAVPHMQARGWGRIINNTTSFFTMLRALPYGATKAALESMSAVWATEFAGTGITVNIVVPGGPTDTAFISDEAGIDRKKMIRPEVMGPPVCWLASEASGDVTGQRFVAALWDPSLPPDRAAEQAGAPIGWPELAANVVWPSDG